MDESWLHPKLIDTRYKKMNKWECQASQIIKNNKKDRFFKEKCIFSFSYNFGLLHLYILPSLFVILIPTFSLLKMNAKNAIFDWALFWKRMFNSSYRFLKVKKSIMSNWDGGGGVARYYKNQYFDTNCATIFATNVC